MYNYSPEDFGERVYSTDDLLFYWNGAHTVNVFTREGLNVDVFSVGDYAQNEATREDAVEGAIEYVEWRWQ